MYNNFLGDDLITLGYDNGGADETYPILSETCSQKTHKKRLDLTLYKEEKIYLNVNHILKHYYALRNTRENRFYNRADQIRRIAFDYCRRLMKAL